MKTIRNLVATLLFCLPLSLFAQHGLKEAHASLTATHKLLVQKHDELNAGKVKDLKKYSEEVGALLTKMNNELSEIDRKHTPKIKESIKTEDEAIKKNHQAAEAKYNQLKEEANKPSPNLVKVKEYSKFMISQIKEAEKQNAAMEKKEESVK